MEITIIHANGKREEKKVNPPKVMPNKHEEVYYNDEPYYVSYRAFDLYGDQIICTGLVLKDGYPKNDGSTTEQSETQEA